MAEDQNVLLNLLLVENESAVISDIVLNLSDKKECSLQVVSTRTEWAESVRIRRPHILILSDAIVQTTGFEVIKELHGDDQTIYKIALLPEKDLERITAYIEAGINQCIFKDGDYVSEVLIAVNNALSRMKPVSDEEAEWMSMLSAFQPGDMILHYRIIEAIGEGGMGEVYKAADLKLGRTVAIKVLPVRISGDPIARKRLIREARSASALNHPNIVTIHAIEETGKSCFIVMEFVEGESLASRIAQQPLEMKYLVEIIAQVADALGAAHAIGLIHRDIKPENIMITKDGHIKLLDFGLAKRSTGAAESVTNLTESGAISGTVCYMSPEQTHGQALDGRTDIFSLGALLYRAATGQLPFSGDSVLDILNAINSFDPPPASTIHRRLPQEFDLILARAMAKDREQRYSTAYEFAEALRKIKTFVSGQSLSIQLDAPVVSKKPTGQVSTDKLVAKRATPNLKPITFTVTKPVEKKHSGSFIAMLLLGIAAVGSFIYYSRVPKQTKSLSEAVNVSNHTPAVPVARMPEEKSATNANVDELTYWKVIKTSSNPRDFRDYLLRYPDGEFADTAWQRIKELEGHSTGADNHSVTPEQNVAPALSQKPQASEPNQNSHDFGNPPLPPQSEQPRPPNQQGNDPNRPGGPPANEFHEAPPPPFFSPRPGSLILTGSTWHMDLNGDVYFHFTPQGSIYMKAPFLQKSGVCGHWSQNPTSISVDACDGSKWQGEREGDHIHWTITSADGGSTSVDSEQASSAVDW